MDELLILNLAGATAKSFFSKCCEELTLTSNNHGGDEEVRECDWRELYLEMLCLCIALEDAVPNLLVTDTFTTDHSSSPYTTLKSQACILLVSPRHALSFILSIFAYIKKHLIIV